MSEPASPVRVTFAVREQLTPAILDEAAVLVQDLVRGGAAIGWVDPPSTVEVGELLRAVAADAAERNAALGLAWAGDELAGLGYWRRYARPTHQPHADIDKIAVSSRHQGRGVGRLLTQALVDEARDAGIEVLTLDHRGDNERAAALYASLGFRRYGLLERFVAVRESRYDKVFLALDLRT